MPSPPGIGLRSVDSQAAEAARQVFSAAELFELRILRDFYVSMRWVVSNIVEPRVLVLEIVDETAFPLIYADVLEVVSTASDLSWS